eukprot:4683655-Prymnesium_polylepis.1
MLQDLHGVRQSTLRRASTDIPLGRASRKRSSIDEEALDEVSEGESSALDDVPPTEDRRSQSLP